MQRFLIKALSVWCLVGLLFALACSFGASVNLFGSFVCITIIAILLLGAFSNDQSHFPIIVFLISLGCYAAIVTLLNYPQISDYEFQIDVARSFLQGDSKAFQNDYFIQYPHFVGYTLLETAILAITHKVVFIKLFEALCSSLILVVFYFIIIEFVRPKIAKVAVCLLALFPAFVLMNNVAGNQILACLLTLIAVSIFLKAIRCREAKKAIIYSCLNGLVLSVACFIRPDSILMLAALALVGIFLPASSLKSADCSDVKTLPKRIAGACTIIVPMFAVFFAFDVLKDLALAQTDIFHPNPKLKSLLSHKLVMGLNPASNGMWYQSYLNDINQTAAEFDLSLDDAAMKIVFDRLQNFPDILSLIVGKAKVLWWDSSFFFALTGAPKNLSDLFYFVDKGFVLLLVISNIVAIAALFKAESVSKNPLGIIATLILGFALLAYLLTEVQARYLYLPYIFMFINAAYGIQILTKRFEVLAKLTAEPNQ